uniref:SRCR domain-containing protein n=1 Tax=Oryzias melastigma TaxID=30732 RepID=A0A3B3BQG3_ORYME
PHPPPAWWPCPLSAGLLCSGEGDVRLTGSESAAEGRVEIFYNSRWETVCDDGWDMRETRVVCRQHPSLKNIYIFSSFPISAPGPIWLDNILCDGDENNLISCESRAWGERDCTHTEDVSVVCSSLTNSTSTHRISLSKDFGQLFETATNCDLNILLQSPTGNRQEDDLPEMDGTTICEHKTILSLFPNFNVFPETTNITVELRKPCHPYFSSLIRYLKQF